MGCDIHAMIERRNDLRDRNGAIYRREWLNSGDPDIGRNYEMFSVLAGVRNYHGIVPIAEPRGLPDFKEWGSYGNGERYACWHHGDEIVGHPCGEMEEMAERWADDGHSHSWLTLAEIKAFDTEQVIDDDSIVLSKDASGAVLSTCRATSAPGPHELVGTRKVLHWPGHDEPKGWLRLIRYMERAKWDDQDDEGVRLVFFFDN